MKWLEQEAEDHYQAALQQASEREARNHQRLLSDASHQSSLTPEEWVNIANMPLLPDPETLAALADSWEQARQAAMRCRWPRY